MEPVSPPQHKTSEGRESIITGEGLYSSIDKSLHASGHWPIKIESLPLLREPSLVGQTQVFRGVATSYHDEIWACPIVR